MRYIDEEAIEKIALGAAVLGTGGGGDPYIGKLIAKEAIRKYGPVALISLEELRDNQIVVPISGMGAPSVTIEKIPSEIEFTAPLDKFEEVIGKKVDVVMPIEIGGINSLFPIIAAAKKGLPLLDADAMGRAFPEAQMVTFHLDGLESSPVTMSDEKGNVVVLYPKDGVWHERLARVITIEMGGSASVCDYGLLVTSFLSNSAIKRPSNSYPPETIMDATSIFSLMSFGQLVNGGIAVVAGFPILITPTLSKRLRSTMAFVQWVVPSMAYFIALLSTLLSLTTFAIASMIPLSTSLVVGTFTV